MLMFLGTLDTEKIGVLEGIIKASFQDHVLGKYYGEPSVQHPDGWGIVIINVGNKKNYVIYKSLNPIFNERAAFRSILEQYNDKKIALLAHARKAATSPRNIESVHPFSYVSDKSTTIFVAHNGLINKEFFAKELNVGEAVFQKLCEGHLFAMWLARFWSKWEKRIKSMIQTGLVKVSPNAFIIELLEDDIALYAISYMNKQRIMQKVKDQRKLEALEEYYRVYYLIKEECVLVSTSTIPDYMDTFDKGEWNSLSLDGEILHVTSDLNIIRKEI